MKQNKIKQTITLEAETRRIVNALFVFETKIEHILTAWSACETKIQIYLAKIIHIDNTEDTQRHNAKKKQNTHAKRIPSIHGT